MDDWIKLIEAIAKLIGSFAWPVAVIIVAMYLLRRHRGAVDRALDRVESLTLPGGVEMTLRESIEEQQQQVLEAVERVAEAEPEEREAAVADLISEAQKRERLVNLGQIADAKMLPRHQRQAALDEINRLTQGFHIARGGRWEPVKTVEDLDQPQEPEPPSS